MSDQPTHCQDSGLGRCLVARFALLTFRSTGGMTWMEGACQGHQELHARQVRAEGGELVAVEVVAQVARSIYVCTDCQPPRAFAAVFQHERPAVPTEERVTERVG